VPARFICRRFKSPRTKSPPRNYHVTPSSPSILKSVFIAAQNGNLYRHQTSFHGACIDTGAQMTVIRIIQAIASCHMIGIPFNPRRSAHSFCFGSGDQRSLGTIPIRIPTVNGAFPPVQVDVVNTNIPFLLGLDFLKRNLSILIPSTIPSSAKTANGREHKFVHI
jgi:Aspartyl protease